LLNATRGGGNTDNEMMKSVIAAAALLSLGTTAFGASAVNLDAEPRTLIVTEGGNKTELALGGGETVEFCQGGCFVTMPNGDRQALTGSETIEISGGVARIK
jgi:hypothetical protein